MRVGGRIMKMKPLIGQVKLWRKVIDGTSTAGEHRTGIQATVTGNQWASTNQSSQAPARELV